MEIAVAAGPGGQRMRSRRSVERLFVQRIAGMMYPEAETLVRAHRRAGHTIAIASSATAFQVAPIARELGIENVLCTEVEVVNGLATGLLAGPVLWGPGKADAVRGFAEDRGIDLEQSYAYGNGRRISPISRLSDGRAR